MQPCEVSLGLGRGFLSLQLRDFVLDCLVFDV